MTDKERPAYPRNLVGYSGAPPHAKWPSGAKIAVQFVINYEEGGENSVLHGDVGAETFLSEIVNAPEVPGARHMSMESIYEYGSRAGVWRLIRLFREFRIPATVFAVATALERNPCMVDEFQLDGHEICSHGLKWINYQNVPEDRERAHIAEAVEILKELTGAAPLGWYTGRTSPNTRRLVVEHGGFLYDADDYSDDLPLWTKVGDANHLVVPYSLDANDMRFATVQGFNSGEQFFAYLRDSFDVLYREGETAPKMMSVGLHGRIVGRPGRYAALERFVRYILDKPDVWLCRRIDIARHWIAHHPAP